MKRAIYIISILLLLSIALNVKYAIRAKQVQEQAAQAEKKKLEETILGIPLQQYATEQSWMNCLMKLGIKSDVVFYGDSHSRWSDFRKYFPDVSICNLGCSGDNLDGFIRRIEMIQTVHPRKIFFMGGINGSKRKPLEEFRQKYDSLYSAIKDSLPYAQLYVQSLLPLNPCVFDKYCDNDKVKQINSIQKELAAKYNLTYIDLYSVYEQEDILPMDVSRDGIHLKIEAYDKWAETIRPYMYE